MGRSSSASSTASTVNESQQIETRQISTEGEGNITLNAEGGSVNFQPTDLGAVDHAFDFADRFGTQALTTIDRTTSHTLDFAGDIASDALAANQHVTDSTVSTLGNAISAVANATRSDTTETFRKVALYAAVAVAVIFVAMALRKR